MLSKSLQLLNVIFIALMASLSSSHATAADLVLGAKIYHDHCVLCHGTYGQGDGRMAKIIKNPPPANLVRSRMPRGYLEKIIELGGAPLGRSPQMPPWGDQLNKVEIESIVSYIESLRESGL